MNNKQYTDYLSESFYKKIPKSVLAALVVNYILNHQGTDEELIEDSALSEWKLLYRQGLISHKPFREPRNAEQIYEPD